MDTALATAIGIVFVGILFGFGFRIGFGGKR